MLRLDAVVPVILIVTAALMTLEPTILGVTITERQIVLAFFGFLGIDSLIERTGRLRRIERRLEVLTEKAIALERLASNTSENFWLSAELLRDLGLNPSCPTWLAKPSA